MNAAQSTDNPGAGFEIGVSAGSVTVESYLPTRFFFGAQPL